MQIAPDPECAALCASGTAFLRAQLPHGGSAHTRRGGGTCLQAPPQQPSQLQHDQQQQRQGVAAAASAASAPAEESFNWKPPVYILLWYVDLLLVAQQSSV